MIDARDSVAYRHLRTLFGVGALGGLPDRQLLETYANRGGDAAEVAFAALVERHGPMVLRTCRAVLRDEHDSQDAFQATFLVLARYSGSLRVQDSLAPWLYRVAYRCALCARSANALRRVHERRAAGRRTEAVDGLLPDDLGAVLHEELGRLPGRLRDAVVLCCLEGLTQEEASRRLGWPIGTLQSRLARGRERLRARLMRRGFSPATGLLAAPRSGVFPSVLLEATVRAALGGATSHRAMAGVTPASAVSLAERVVANMIMSKIRVAGILAVGLVGMGMATSAGQGERRPPAPPVPGAPPSITYEIRAWRDGRPMFEPVVVRGVEGRDIHVVTGEVRIHIEPRSSSGAAGDGPDPVEGLGAASRDPLDEEGRRAKDSRREQQRRQRDLQVEAGRLLGEEVRRLERDRQLGVLEGKLGEEVHQLEWDHRLKEVEKKLGEILKGKDLSRHGQREEGRSGGEDAAIRAGRSPR